MLRFSYSGALPLLACAITALTLSGCYTTTISSGAPPAEPKIEYDDKWHHGFVYGIAEVSGPYDLKEICPQGWGEIKTETSFLNGLVSGLTYSIYTPQSVTVACKASTSAAVAESAPEAEAPAAEDASAEEASE